MITVNGQEVLRLTQKVALSEYRPCSCARHGAASSSICLPRRRELEREECAERTPGVLRLWRKQSGAKGEQNSCKAVERLEDKIRSLTLMWEVRGSQ